MTPVLRAVVEAERGAVEAMAAAEYVVIIIN
jgi:hypothetical protein